MSGQTDEVIRLKYGYTLDISQTCRRDRTGGFFVSVPCFSLSDRFEMGQIETTVWFCTSSFEVWLPQYGTDLNIPLILSRPGHLFKSEKGYRSISSSDSVPFRTFSEAEQMVRNCVIIQICPISSIWKGKTDGTEWCHLPDLYQPVDFRILTKYGFVLNMTARLFAARWNTWGRSAMLRTLRIPWSPERRVPAGSEFSEYVQQMRYKKTIFHEIKIVIMYNAFNRKLWWLFQNAGEFSWADICLNNDIRTCRL